MRPLALILCLSLCGCVVPPVVQSDYRTRMTCVDFEEQTVDIGWVKTSRIVGEPDRCGTTRIDYGAWQTMSEADILREIMMGLRDTDVRYGADCSAKKGK